jgi:hypothetical protein
MSLILCRALLTFDLMTCLSEIKTLAASFTRLTDMAPPAECSELDIALETIDNTDLEVV